MLPGRLGVHPFPPIHRLGVGAFPPPIIPVGHENIPWKHKQRERKNTGFSLCLREVEEQDVEYLLSLCMTEAAKYALFCSRVWLLLTKLW